MATNNLSLGELLVGIHAITPEQLEEALTIQKTEGRLLGEILMGLGYITETQLMRALEYRFRIPFYDLTTVSIPNELSHLISPQIARKYTVVPLSVADNKLTLAVSDPMNFQAMDEVRLQSKMDVRPVLATSSDIKSAIIRLYEETQTSKAVEELNREYTMEDVEQLSEEINEAVDNAPVVRLVNLIIDQAINSRASDIHIEPLEDSVRIRFRIDGELYEQLKLRKSSLPAIITRLKIMGNMDIAEKRIPQDGQVRTVFNGMNMDLRLSVLPTINGEKISIRILGGRGIVLERKQLGFTDSNSKMFDEILKNPNGIILVSGPTGSGKSTTLYTALRELNRPGINIVTVEDPVEYRMENVNQVQINPKAGLTFAAGLRSILRQDPDIIMVGEIRDGETAEIAVRASITGHLVLSTIHTNDSASTVTRLIDMGIQPFLVSASLVGVVAQRLVRHVCPRCKVARMTDLGEMELLGLTEPAEIFSGVGCPYCNNTGHRGRTAIHEILVMNRDIRRVIDQKGTVDDIRRISQQFGTRTLHQSCADLVLSGQTSVEEMLRVAYTEE